MLSIPQAFLNFRAFIKFWTLQGHTLYGGGGVILSFKQSLDSSQYVTQVMCCELIF